MKSWPSQLIEDEFPALRQKVNEHDLIYLDSAASSLKPKRMVQRLSDFYLMESSNVHRGAHYLSDRATQNFENTRHAVAQFISATHSNEIVFTKGTTEGLNLLSRCLGALLEPGDEIILSEMEHHANIVPWQIIAQEKKLILKFIPVNKEVGSLDFDHYQKLLNKRTRIVSLVHCSNALGTINPLRDFFTLAHEVRALTIADCAQSIACMPIKVDELLCDFLVFSGHKMLGPNGIGILWGRQELLNQLPPYQGGGAMIDKVTLAETTFLSAPQRFEAGTPPIGEAIALEESLRFLQEVGRERIQKHEFALAEQARRELKKIPHLKVLGDAPLRGNIVSFVPDNCHPSDLGHLLNQEGIAVRVGHHCTQPLMAALGITGTVRVSFSLYNKSSDVIRLVEAINKAMDILK